MTRSKCLISWSSGKDSAWMVHVLRQRGDIEIGALLTTINEPAQRVAMHAVRVELLKAQADALALPLWIVPIPSPCPNEIYEQAMAGAVRRAVTEGFTQVAFGDLFLADIRRYREERLANTGLTPIFPLFDADTPRLAREMVTRYGMSQELGPLVYGESDELVFLGREIHESRNYSEKTAERIDAEVTKLVHGAMEVARGILKKEKMHLDKIVKVLMEKETIERDEFAALFPAA